ncbi:MAG TPA: iron ABC transporter permease [Stellaceae bacterium]|nr:iron ABC transporter permease [Stellaceae bacterium]
MASIAEQLALHRYRHRSPGRKLIARPLAIPGWGIALTVLLPILSLAAIASRGSGALWPHLVAYVLPQAALETSMLLAGTAAVVIGIGTGTAWLVAGFRFPGRSVLAWALLMPLAMPAYVVAYAYMDLLHPVGPVQSGLRALLGVASPQDLRLPEFRSLGGAILLFGFVLYPYVYLNVRANFLMQSAEVVEAARIFGSSGRRLFLHIALPLARPAIVAGAALALMETLGDLGACELLGVQSLTVSVYVTWVTRGSIEGAAQIALAMLVPVAAVILMTYAPRSGRSYASASPQPLAARQLGPIAGILAAIACAIPIVLGFVIPAVHLGILAVTRLAEHGVSPLLLSSAWNSARFAATATVLAVAAGFVIAFCQRRTALAGPVRVTQIGYAVPGTVLAVGLLGLLSAADIGIGLIGIESLRGLLLAASGIGVIMAYLARFLAIPASGIEAGFAKLPHALDEAAQAAGAGAVSIARQIHWPLLQPAVRTAALLMFIECVKELPATLLLRSLNTETLATFLYAEASRGVYEDGAIAALGMAGLGLLPIIVLSRSASYRRSSLKP